MRSVFVKQGPVVFLRDVLLMEIGALLLAFLASYVENYEMLYRGWGLDQTLRYDHFLLIASALFQFVYIISLFLSWYFSYFEIKENEITKKTGILFHSRKSYRFSDIVSVETYQTPIDRLIKHATIILEHKNGKKIRMQNIPNFGEYVHLIKQYLPDGTPKKSIALLIRGGESATLEFKETLRYDVRKNEINKEIERAILKSIVGFLNTNGGTLLIGVNNNGEICGLDRDYASLPQKNRDGFENHLNTLVRSAIGVQFSKYLSLHFEIINNKEVCAINVRASHKPAYLKASDKKEEFFVRVGNATHPLSMSEAEEHIKSNFN